MVTVSEKPMFKKKIIPVYTIQKKPSHNYSRQLIQTPCILISLFVKIVII